MSIKEEEAVIQEWLIITTISLKEADLCLILKGLCVKFQELFSHLLMERLTLHFKMQLINASPHKHVYLVKDLLV